MILRDFITALNHIWPSSLSCSWDNDGAMCVPLPDRPVKKILLTLDITEGAVDRAIQEGCDVILSHHPLIFSPLRHLDADDLIPHLLCRLVKAEIAALSFHTRLDAAQGGVNDCLCDTLGMNDREVWMTEGQPMARLCRIAPIKSADLAKLVKEKLKADSVTYTCPDRTIRKVLVVGGSGKDFIEEALAAKADALITGEISYNAAALAADRGLALIMAGHFFTENPVLGGMKQTVYQLDSSIETVTFHSNLIHVTI